ncbi:hypothetical protein ACLKA6_016367 [Drosophila palustris]
MTGVSWVMEAVWFEEDSMVAAVKTQLHSICSSHTSTSIFTHTHGSRFEEPTDEGHESHSSDSHRAATKTLGGATHGAARKRIASEFVPDSTWRSRCHTLAKCHKYMSSHRLQQQQAANISAGAASPCTQTSTDPDFVFG